MSLWQSLIFKTSVNFDFYCLLSYFWTVVAAQINQNICFEKIQVDFSRMPHTSENA